MYINTTGLKVMILHYNLQLFYELEKWIFFSVLPILKNISINNNDTTL